MAPNFNFKYFLFDVRVLLHGARVRQRDIKSVYCMGRKSTCPFRPEMRQYF